MSESKEKILILSNNNYIFDILKQVFKDFDIVLKEKETNQKDFILTVEDINDEFITIYNSIYKNYHNISKPFKLDYITIQLNKILNIAYNITNIADLIYNNILMTLTNNISGHYIELTKIENDILAYLINGKASEASKHDILSNVLGYNNETDTHTVENHIYRLRQKISNISQENIICTDKNGKYYINYNI